MFTPKHSQSRSLTAQNTHSPLSLLSSHFSRTNADRKTVVYIEPPPLPSTERVTYEAVSNRDLPENFDYSLPLSDRVIVGEHRDNATHWYYVENADSVVYRVSTLLILKLCLALNLPPSHKITDIR